MADEPRRSEVPMLSDCPIQPHVWREFLGRPREESLELIAHVRPGDSAQIVAGMLRQWLPLTGRTDANSIFAYDAYVLVDVDFEGVVTALLPLTGWSDLLRKMETLSSDELTYELDAAKAVISGNTNPRSLTLSQASLRLSHEDYGRMCWLFAQLVAVVPDMTTAEIMRWVDTAVERAPAGPAPLLSVSYNRWAEPAVWETRKTIKADAAETLFEVDCSDITWAVVDTGIDATHPMFATPAVSGTSTAPSPPPVQSRIIEAYDVPAGVAALRRKAAHDVYSGIGDDTDWEEFAQAARVMVDGDPPVPDRFDAAANDHGTHVAGILAGSTHKRVDLQDSWQANVRGDEPDELRGICPTLKILDIRVFNAAGVGREFEVVIGLAFIGWLNRRPGKRIDGVNVSLSIPFAVDNFACGWTPVCLECERLVAGGLVVVSSAGNSGFDDSRGTMSIGAGFQMVSISDPGNAEAVITVGATHRTDPHRYGPISRSARGPTADGRHKPDVLAPGDSVWGPVPKGGWGRKSGTSQAAPHVSAVAAMLLARYPELRGRPDRVKEIVCETATDLRRLVDFQGAGLVDALRALQRP